MGRRRRRPPPAPSSSSSSSSRKTATTAATAVEVAAAAAAAAAAPAVDDFTRITYADALRVLSAMDLSVHAHAITVRDDRAAGLPHASPSITLSPTPLPPLGARRPRRRPGLDAHAAPGPGVRAVGGETGVSIPTGAGEADPTQSRLIAHLPRPVTFPFFICLMSPAPHTLSHAHG